MLPTQIHISSPPGGKANLLTWSCGEEKRSFCHRGPGKLFRDTSAHRCQNSLGGLRKAFFKDWVRERSHRLREQHSPLIGRWRGNLISPQAPGGLQTVCSRS